MRTKVQKFFDWLTACGVGAMLAWGVRWLYQVPTESQLIIALPITIAIYVGLRYKRRNKS